jgi:hypothetical protein
MTRDLTWRHVTVIVAFFLTIAALSVTGHDTGALITIGLAILAGLGVVAANTATVKNQTNGTVADLLRLMREMSLQLAQMAPPAPPTPPEGTAAPPDGQPTWPA